MAGLRPPWANNPARARANIDRREAISELVTEGLLEKLPEGGVAVPPLYVKDLQDVYEIRQTLESQAVRHVAAHRPWKV